MKRVIILFAILWIAIPHSLFSQVSSPDAEAEVLSEAPDTTPAVRAAEQEIVFDDAPAAGAAASTLPGILRMVLVLALVAALIYFVVFFLKKMSRPQTEQNPHLKILATTHLGGGRFVHVISVGKSAWLIGAGEGGLSHIADITDQEEIDAMQLDSSRKSLEENKLVLSFQSILKRFSSPAGPSSDRLENLRKRRENFKRF